MSATRIDKELEAFVEKVMLVYSEHVEADDELSDWHLEKPIILARQKVKLVNDLEPLLTKAQLQLLDELMEKAHAYEMWTGTNQSTGKAVVVQAVPLEVLEKKRATLQGGDK